MSFTERLIGCAIGALSVGFLAALAGFGPERVVTGLLAIAAATLAGALLDDLLESRVKMATAQLWADREQKTAGPDLAPPPYPPTNPPREDESRGSPPDTSPEPPTTRPPRRPVTPPATRWVVALPPTLDQPSGRWSGPARDLASYLSRSPVEDVTCTLCGRTVVRPAGGVPADCPISDRQSCRLQERSDRHVTEFRSLRDVSNG